MPSIRWPYCQETILAVAVKCKHCGEFIKKRPASPGRESGVQEAVQRALAIEKASDEAGQSVIAACLGLVFVGIILGPASIYMAYSANSKLERNGAPKSGAATAAIVIGSIVSLLWFGGIALLVQSANM